MKFEYTFLSELIYYLLICLCFLKFILFANIVCIFINVCFNFQIVLKCFVCFISTVLGTKSLTSAAVILSNKQNNWLKLQAGDNGLILDSAVHAPLLGAYCSAFQFKNDVRC